MKRILLLLVGFISSLCIWADTTYTISFNGSDSQSTAGYFSKSGNQKFNSKFNGATYAGITFTSGLKMESTTLVGFTNANTATVVIVQSTWSDNTIKFDGTELAVTSATEETGYRVYTIENVSAAIHKIERGGGESGLFYISVTEAAATSPTVKTMPLSATYALSSTTTATPLEVDVAMVDETNDHLVYQWYTCSSSNIESGTSTAILGATSNSYTPDVTAVGTIYYYCVITEKDGDGNQVGNSAYTNTVAIEVIASVEAPTVNEFNGTVQLDCSTTSAVLYYSLDNGTTWIEYTRPFTVLDNDVTVQAKAQVGGGTLTSEIVYHDVVAVKKKENSSSIVLYYNTDGMKRGENSDGAENAALNGNDESDYEGWNIEITGTGKPISNANAINGYTTIKNSNGRQMLVTMPDGVVANRITLYSYVNVADATANKNYWSEIAGTTYGQNSIAMASFQDTSNPDIRVYALDDIDTEFTFNNNGVNQLCFYAVIDYTVNAASVSLNSEGLATYSGAYDVYVSTEGAQAYTCKLDDDNATIEAQAITGNKIPAYNGVLIYGTPNTTVRLIKVSDASDLGSNDLKPTTTAEGTAALESNALALSGNVFKTFTGTAFDANKAYLVANSTSGEAKTYTLRFLSLDEEEEATAVETVETPVEGSSDSVRKTIKDGRLLIETPAGVFTLSGARVK